MVEIIVDIISLVSIFVIINLSLNLEYGYTGIPNFGKVFFVAAGAYVVGALTGRIILWIYGLKIDFIKENSLAVTKINEILSNEIFIGVLVFIFVLTVSLIVGALLGFILSLPAIRLREEYLAISLLILGEALRIFAYNYEPLVGGTLGVSVPDPFIWVNNYGINRFHFYAILLVSLAFITYFLVNRMVNSPLGRTLRAIRENPLTAEVYGKNIVRYRMKVLMISSALASMAGGLYAFYTANVIATTYNRFDWTFWPWLMVIIGGLGNNIGVTLGALIVIVTRKLIVIYKYSFEKIFPFRIEWLEYILLGIVFIMILIYKPEGILKEKPVETIPREKIEKLRKTERF